MGRGRCAMWQRVWWLVMSGGMPLRGSRGSAGESPSGSGYGWRDLGGGRWKLTVGRHAGWLRDPDALLVAPDGGTVRVGRLGRRRILKRGQRG